ncbi:hypothetical protein GOBAR_DD23313 [Gossypium barbadense]|nr:hypothetical protein GOBAR_DD23313 [Gossypium barbadense]
MEVLSALDPKTPELPQVQLDNLAGNYPSSSMLNQRHQFFEQQHGYTGSSSHSITGFDSSYDSLVGQTQNLSINSKIATQQVNPEDSFFRDLLDFAKPCHLHHLNPIIIHVDLLR